MNKIEAFFCIVTPMFLGGADGQTELRMQSVKGLLRFWWRTFVYPSVNGDLKKLAEKEAQLFGSNENCASFQLHFSSNVNPLIKTSKGETFQKMVNPDRPGARYLGFGLMDAFDGKKTTAGRLSKGCINHNQEFSISAIARNEFSNDLIRTFKLFGLLGGLGSRSRKGFGSITLTRIKVNDREYWVRPETTDAYRQELISLLGEATKYNQEPKISAFSTHTRINYIGTNPSPLSLLNTWGKQMQRYRSWGFKGKVNGRKSEQNFKKDHHWYRFIGNYRENDFHPRRVIFGLPHNYDSKKEEGCVTGKIHDRRASPLFFHIHEFSPRKYGAVALLLRSVFLPNGEKINAGGKSVPQAIEWKVLNEFFDNKKYFSNIVAWV
jgi:CRISPR-associated protein Cmr1